jgi:hypothetical protein
MHVRSVRSQEGTIEIDCPPAGGTTVTIWLVLAPVTRLSGTMTR